LNVEAPPAAKKRPGLLKKILPFVLTALIMALLLRQISWAEFAAMFRHLSWPWFGVGLAIYGLTNWCRAMRLHILLPQRPTRLPHLTLITTTQSMFNNALPARTGELTLVYLLYRFQAVPLEEAALALVIARLFDYFAVAVLFIVAALVSLNHLPAAMGYIIMAVALAMAVSIALLLALVSARYRSLALIHSLLERLQWAEHRWVSFGLQKTAQIIEAFEAVHSLRQHVTVFFWSLVIWLCTFLWFQAFLLSVDIHTGFLTMTIGATFAVLSKAIPFISVGGLGAHEAGWTLGFMLIGFDTALAVSSGLAVNLLTLLASLMLGLPSLLLLRYTAPKPHPETS
jgi:uncharacterized protein (TIRG00374 family)